MNVTILVLISSVDFYLSRPSISEVKERGLFPTEREETRRRVSQI